MKKSITTKLFFITLIGLFIFISAAMLFQYAFFETFYLNRKVANMKESIEEFKKVVKKQPDIYIEEPKVSFVPPAAGVPAGESLTAQAIMGSPAISGCIELSQSGSLNITSSTMSAISPASTQFPVIDTLTPASIEITIEPGSARIETTETMRNTTLSAIQANTPSISGASISLKIKETPNEVGYITDMKQLENTNNSILAVLNLKHGNILFSSDAYSSGNNPEQSKILLLDTVLFSEITRQINNWMGSKTLYDTVVKEGMDHVARLENGSSTIKKLLVISPVKDSSGISKVIFSLATLQPVNEAAEVIKEYYIYIFAAAALLIILLSWIFSNMISKPLLRINKSALHMAQLDFSTECQVTSDDELGNLSETLNFLSHKLGNTLNELNDANERLKEDICQQKRQEKIRTDFFSSISHELKTPISLIQGYAEGIKDGIADEADKDFYLDVIIDEACRMSGLISDMLDLSQLESGNFRLELQEFDLSGLVSGIIRKHSFSFGEKDVVVTFNGVSGELTVTADRSRIHQVLVNLLGNAVRHIPAGGKIIVSVSEDEENAKVQIENQGNPIPEEEMEYIWERFYKVDKSGNRSNGGYGIGLAVVRSILELHKAAYGVRNTYDGVMFYFELKKTCVEEEK